MARWPTGPFTLGRTGCYGCRRLSSADGGCGVHGYPCTHWGMDLFAGSDRRVVAPESGVVVAVANGSAPPWSGFGPGVVVVRGVSGVFHLLSHLEYSTIQVGVGLPVSEGTPIGKYDARIAHTHYEVRRKLTGPSAENTIDPKVWLEAQGDGGGGIGKLLLLAGLFGAGVWLSRRVSPA